MSALDEWYKAFDDHRRIRRRRDRIREKIGRLQELLADADEDLDSAKRRCRATAAARYEERSLEKQGN